MITREEIEAVVNRIETDYREELQRAHVDYHAAVVQRHMDTMRREDAVALAIYVRERLLPKQPPTPMADYQEWHPCLDDGCPYCHSDKAR